MPPTKGTHQPQLSAAASVAPAGAGRMPYRLLAAVVMIVLGAVLAGSSPVTARTGTLGGTTNAASAATHSGAASSSPHGTQHTSAAAPEHASAATVRFTAATTTVSSPGTLSVATDSSGVLIGQTEIAAVAPQASAPMSAVYTPGSRVIVALTLISGSRVAETSPAGLALSSANHHYTCVTTTAVTIAPLGSARQYCALPTQPVSSDAWHYRNASAHLSYFGTNLSGGSLAGYVVPASCGNPASAVAAVDAALNAQLSQLTPAHSLVFYGPVFSIFTQGITCSPAVGYVAPRPFSYREYLGGSAIQSSVALSDMQTYQSQALQAAASATTFYTVLRSTSICPGGPTVQPGATSTRAAIQCPASGLAVWSWDSAALGRLASALRGVTVASAIAYLKSLPGVVPGSVVITDGGAALMPGNATAITIQVE